MNIKKKETLVWNGSHKGVDFEINNWNRNGSEHWCYYLILKLDRIPKENNPDSFWLNPGDMGYGGVLYKYYDHEVISDLDWHGGITWYEKKGGFDGTSKIIKIGCDYQHYTDEGRKYTLNDIKYDVEGSINRFLEYVPDYKYWCCGNGKLYDLKEGILKSDKFHSEEYYGDKEWYKKEKKFISRQRNISSILENSK